MFQKKGIGWTCDIPMNDMGPGTNYQHCQRWEEWIFSWKAMRKWTLKMVAMEAMANIF